MEHVVICICLLLDPFWWGKEHMNLVLPNLGGSLLSPCLTGGQSQPGNLPPQKGQKHTSTSSSYKWMVDILATVTYGDERKVYTVSPPANMPQSSFSEADPSLLFLWSSEISTIPWDYSQTAQHMNSCLFTHLLYLLVCEDRYNTYAFNARGTLATFPTTARWSGPSPYWMCQSTCQRSRAGYACHPTCWRYSLGT